MEYHFRIFSLGSSGGTLYNKRNIDRTLKVEGEQKTPNEKDSGVKLVDLLRGIKKSMRGVNPILKTSFDILHSLVDNQIVLTLAPIIKESGALGMFGFLL